MTELVAGREPVQIVEIVQPYCNNTHGSAPCTATETGDRKCFNTRSTCNDTANFAKGSLRLFFAKGNIADRLDVSYLTTEDGETITTEDGDPIEIGDAKGAATYIVPSLVSVSTSPTRINLAGANPDAQGLGNRALCSIVFQDHPHTDRVVDPYRSDRTYVPMERGSFWTKWLARNTYRYNLSIKIYEGYFGETLESMRVREYFLARITGPDNNGHVTVQGKDILSFIEERKAQAPLASPGELYADIDSSQTSFEVANAVAADYSASGTIRIGDELMTYSAVASSANGITFTITLRGTDGSTAAEHSAEDLVQECLRYTSQSVDTVVEDLLDTYGGIAASYMDTANWAAEVSAYLSGYSLTTLITQPTGVATLVSEIQEQVGCFLWWDEHSQLIKLRAIRAVEDEPGLITDDNHIIAGSFNIDEMPRQRISQLWVYFVMNDWTGKLDDETNWRYLYISADLESEGANLYGQKSIRKIYARWLPTNAMALNTATKTVSRYSGVPRQCTFRLDAKDRANYGVGDIVRISHFRDVNANGANNIGNWTITSMHEVVPGELTEYTAEDTTIYGRVCTIQGAGAGDYDPVTATFNAAYIGDANGRLSDGTNCARIT
jgi:hypothetical protein